MTHGCVLWILIGNGLILGSFMNVDRVMCQKKLILVNLNNLRCNSINMVNLISTIEDVILSYFVNFNHSKSIQINFGEF